MLLFTSSIQGNRVNSGGRRLKKALAMASLIALVVAPLTEQLLNISSIEASDPVNRSLIPIADTYVSSSSPTSNFGASTSLLVDSSSEKITYLKFNLYQIPDALTSAKLRVYVTNGSVDAQNLHAVSDTSWGETTMTYNNKPTVSSEIIGTMTKATSPSTWHEFDLTSFVENNRGQTVSLAFDATGPDDVFFNSREASTNSIELVVDGSDMQDYDAAVVNPVADTYVAADHATTNYGSSTTLKSDSDPAMEAYLKFDLANALGPNDRMLSATLNLFVNNGSVDSYVAKEMPVAWDDQNVTYNTKPTLGSTIGTFPVMLGSGSWISLDVTASVQSHLEQAWAVAVASTGNDGLGFNSLDMGSFMPELVIEREESIYPALNIMAPVADAYTQSDLTTSNFGGSSTLQIDGSPDKATFMKFDLRHLANKIITFAHVNVYVTNPSNDATPVYAITTDWQESSITYSNQPSLTGASLIGDASLSVINTVQEIELDLSEYAGQLVTVAIPHAGTDGLTFSSRDSANSPKLYVEYTEEPSALTTTATSHHLGVVVLKYFPLTQDGQNIDINETGDWGASYTSTRQKTIDITNNLLNYLPKATSYLRYSNSSATPSLNYKVVDTHEYTQAVPKTTTGRYPQYNQILLDHNVCDYVNNQSVKEFWIWAYQGPNKSDGYPYLRISESKMAGPYGDYSNSYTQNDMPVCDHTYRVYTFNYQRGTAEAVHSWGHQIEAEMRAVEGAGGAGTLFEGLFQGLGHPQADLISPSRCGNVHNPANSIAEYDYANTSAWTSDCLDWQPDGGGTTSQISCSNWGCSHVSDSNNPQLNYLIWNFQNMPGIGNAKTYQGSQLRNWWDVHGNFDYVMELDEPLLLTN